MGYQQEQGGVVNLDKMGRQLSLETGCTIKVGDNGFVCLCGVMFPLGELTKSSDWAWTKEKHDKEGRKQ